MPNWQAAFNELERRGIKIENLGHYRDDQGKLRDLLDDAIVINSSRMNGRLSYDWNANMLDITELAYLYAKSRGVCQGRCRQPLTHIHIDHINPRSLVTRTESTKFEVWNLDNLQLACPTCNQQQGDKVHPTERVRHFQGPDGEYAGACRATQGPAPKKFRDQGARRLMPAQVFKEVHEDAQRYRDIISKPKEYEEPQAELSSMPSSRSTWGGVAADTSYPRHDVVVVDHHHHHLYFVTEHRHRDTEHRHRDTEHRHRETVFQEHSPEHSPGQRHQPVAKKEVYYPATFR